MREGGKVITESASRNTMEMERERNLSFRIRLAGLISISSEGIVVVVVDVVDGVYRFMWANAEVDPFRGVAVASASEYNVIEWRLRRYRVISLSLLDFSSNPSFAATKDRKSPKPFRGYLLSFKCERSRRDTWSCFWATHLTNKLYSSAQKGVASVRLPALCRKKKCYLEFGFADECALICRRHD